MPNNSDSGWKLHLVHHNSCQVYTTNIIRKERPHFKQTPRRYKCPKLFSKGKTPLFDVNINIGCFLFVIAPIILKGGGGGGGVFFFFFSFFVCFVFFFFLLCVLLVLSVLYKKRGGGGGGGGGEGGSSAIITFFTDTHQIHFIKKKLRSTIASLDRA